MKYSGTTTLTVFEDFLNAPTHNWYMTTEEGITYNLQWNSVGGSAPIDMRPNARIEVETEENKIMENIMMQPQQPEYILKVSNYTILNSDNSNTTQASVLPVGNIKPNYIRSIVLIHDFSACTPWNPSSGGAWWKTSDVYDFLYQNKKQVSLESQMRACSHGGFRFANTFKKVVVVKVPSHKCQGSIVDIWGIKREYSWNDCPKADDMQYYLNEMERIAIEQVGQLSKYQYRWHLISKSQARGPNCVWAGLATVGCGERGPDRDHVCRSMIWPGYANEIFLWQHEVGHNLGLYHAGALGMEYADESCSMGGWGQQPFERCYNLPHATQLGWTKPRSVHHSSLVGKKTMFTITAADILNTSGLEIKTKIKAAQQNPEQNRVITVYLSYRTRSLYSNLKKDASGKTKLPFGGDLGLDDQYIGLLLHLNPDPRPQAGERSSLEGRVPARVGQSITDTYTGMAFRVVYADESYLTVEVTA